MGAAGATAASVATGSASAAMVGDAPVGAAWFLPDEATPHTEAALQATAEREVHVPALGWPEIGKLSPSARRRQRIDADKRRDPVARAQALRLRVDREPVAMTARDEPAARHGPSACDALYLEPALRRRLPPATTDAASLAAMRACAVDLARP